MADRIHIISSMTPRRLLEAALSEWNGSARGVPGELKSVGGVDAARTVEAGTEPCDAVVLGSKAIGRLEQAGCIVPGTAIGLALARVAVAVKAGAPKPDLAGVRGVRQAVLAAERIGYSTGPSGTAMLRLFEAWGVDQQLRGRLVQARPGVPVGTLVATGKATLGFQQLSELIHVEGIDVVGTLPPEIEIRTVFSGAVVRTSRVVDAARAFLAFVASDACDAARRAEGLEPVARHEERAAQGASPRTS